MTGADRRIPAARVIRVLWLTKGLGRGGAEQLLVNSLPLVDRARFNISVAYVLPWKDALVGELERRDATVFGLGSKGAADVRWAYRLRRLVADQRIDLVHTHSPSIAAIARVVVPRRVRFVHTEHNMWSRYRSVTRWANALTYPRNAAVLAVSNAVAESIRVPTWVAREPPEVSVVYQGADRAAVYRGPEARSDARRALAIAPDDLVVGTVGNFTAKKDQATLLAAVASLTREHDRLRLVLVGTGPLEDELRRRARELGVEERVMFTGMRDDVLALLPAFDVFTLSSRYEGLPISLLEAMASGLPCVVTRVGGIPEVVTDGHEGLLAAPGDSAALAAALDELLLDLSLRAQMGARAAERATEFDLRSAVERTERIYERALQA
jgi:glycosyltransferase involved in cell wall biosynthesis